MNHLMNHTIHNLDDGVYHRFQTIRGTVWAVVHRLGNAEAGLDVYEQDAALASRGLTDDVAHQLPQAVAARNRFGTGLMLRAMKIVRAATPDVRRWVYERKSGANAGRQHERAV